jgi:hypothetical protein
MRTLPLVALTILASSALAQDFIHYKFDANCTAEVINYATGPQALAANGVFQSNATTQFDAGAFGGCLAGGSASPAGYNRVITGWDPGTQNVTGSLTMAWFMKERYAPGTGLSYLAGAPSGGFRLFTNGVASTGLYQRTILAGGGNGVNASITNDFWLPPANANIQALAAAGWIHVAMVIDATAQTADWYVNGVSVLQLPNVPGALINAPGPFQLGYYSLAAGSPYDIDEFVMSLRAYSAGEILALSLAPKAGDGDYRSGIPSQCGAGNVTLVSSGGAPALSNFLYGLDVSTTTTSLYVLLLGLDRCSFGGAIPLPLDGTPLAPLLSGCWILADAPVTLAGVASPVPATIPLPILPSFPLGAAIYSQVLALDGVTFATSMSNGFVSSIGG